MYNQEVFQPLNISAAEWKLLRHLATYTESFEVETVLSQQQDETSTQSETQNFYRHFHRLKNCGYLEVAPSVVIQAQDSDAHSYRLSAEGLKAVSPKERPLYPVKSLAARKVHKLNVLLSK